MHAAGYKLGNVDATIILQRPKLSPHKETIRANLCRLLDADPSVVNIKVASHLPFCVMLGLAPVPGVVHCHISAKVSSTPQAQAALSSPSCAPCRHIYTVWMRQAKTHEKVDSLGENRSIAVHAVIMLIREDLYDT